MVKICSGITRGRVLKGELYTHGIPKLMYLHLRTELFHKDFLSFIRTNTEHLLLLWWMFCVCSDECSVLVLMNVLMNVLCLFWWMFCVCSDECSVFVLMNVLCLLWWMFCVCSDECSVSVLMNDENSLWNCPVNKLSWINFWILCASNNQVYPAVTHFPILQTLK